MVKGIRLNLRSAWLCRSDTAPPGRHESAEDEKFFWIGRTPLDDELDMATGRFYFRLKPN